MIKCTKVLKNKIYLFPFFLILLPQVKNCEDMQCKTNTAKRWIQFKED